MHAFDRFWLNEPIGKKDTAVGHCRTAIAGSNRLSPADLQLRLVKSIDDSLLARILSLFPETRCTDEPDYACGDVPAVASCITHVGELSQSEVEAGCELSLERALVRLVCASDL